MFHGIRVKLIGRVALILNKQSNVPVHSNTPTVATPPSGLTISMTRQLKH